MRQRSTDILRNFVMRSESVQSSTTHRALMDYELEYDDHRLKQFYTLEAELFSAMVNWQRCRDELDKAYALLEAVRKPWDNVAQKLDEALTEIDALEKERWMHIP